MIRYLIGRYILRQGDPLVVAVRIDNTSLAAGATPDLHQPVISVEFGNHVASAKIDSSGMAYVTVDTMSLLSGSYEVTIRQGGDDLAVPIKVTILDPVSYDKLRSVRAASVTHLAVDEEHPVFALQDYARSLFRDYLEPIEILRSAQAMTPLEPLRVELGNFWSADPLLLIPKTQRIIPALEELIYETAYLMVGGATELSIIVTLDDSMFSATINLSAYQDLVDLYRIVVENSDLSVTVSGGSVSLSANIAIDTSSDVATGAVDRIARTNEFSEAVPSDSYASNMPATSTTFVGRHQELRKLFALLANEKSCVVITGARGVGKTSLAREFAQRFTSIFPGGVQTIYRDHPDHFIDFTNDYLWPDRPSRRLCILDDIDAGPVGDIEQFIRSIRNKSNVFVVFIAHQLPGPLASLPRISLNGLSEHDIRSLVSRILPDDQNTSALLTQLSHKTLGNPALITDATEIVQSGTVSTLRDLLGYIRDFRISGMIDPSGSPLSDLSTQSVVKTVAHVNNILNSTFKDEKHATGLHFQDSAADVLQQQGYLVDAAPRWISEDIDLFSAQHDKFGSFLYIVDAKRADKSARNGVRMVSSLRGTANLHGANLGVVLNTSYVTAGFKASKQVISRDVALNSYVALQQWLDASLFATTE